MDIRKQLVLNYNHNNNLNRNQFQLLYFNNTYIKYFFCPEGMHSCFKIIIERKVLK